MVFLTYNDFLLEKHLTARDRSRGGVVLWESKTTVSFRIKRKTFFYVCVIREARDYQTRRDDGP